MERPKPRLTARTRNMERWRIIVTVCVVVLGLAVLTAGYFALTPTELVDSATGRTLDCGSVVAPSTTALAGINCGGINDGNVVGLVVAAIVALAAISLMVGRVIRENRGINW